MSQKDMEGQMDFLGLISEYTDDQGATVRIREPGRKRTKPLPPPEFEQVSLNFEMPEIKPEIKPEPVLEPPKPEPVKQKAEEPKPVPKEEPVKPKTEATKPVAKPIPKAEPKEEPPKDVLFKQCARCWCNDCKHNSRNAGVPRDFGGISMACPACDGCISDDCATICEIGNAKEGCMTRALEEGIVVRDEYEE